MYRFGTNSGVCPPTGHVRFGLDRVLCNAKISGDLERKGQGHSGREWTVYCFRNGCGRVWKLDVENKEQPAQPEVPPLMVPRCAPASHHSIVIGGRGSLTRSAA